MLKPPFRPRFVTVFVLMWVAITYLAYTTLKTPFAVVLVSLGLVIHVRDLEQKLSRYDYRTAVINLFAVPLGMICMLGLAGRGLWSPFASYVANLLISLVAALAVALVAYMIVGLVMRPTRRVFRFTDWLTAERRR